MAAVEDNSKRTNEKLNKFDDRVDGLEMTECLHRDKMEQFQGDNVKLQDSITYLQSQSMRNNLIISNSKEVANEKPGDTSNTLRTFMIEQLEIAAALVN